MTTLDPRLITQRTLTDEIAIFNRLGAVHTALRVLVRTTGLRIAVVARVTPGSWTACAVHDDARFGLKPGDQLDVNTTYCKVVRDDSEPLIIQNAREDPRFCNYPALHLYGVESYIAVPLNRPDGTRFGVLCALDTRPAELAPELLDTFQLMSQLISFELEAEERREHETAHMRALEDFIAIAAHDLRQPITALYGNTQLLARSIQKGADPSTLTARVDSLLAQTRRAIRLSDVLLDIARIESDTLELKLNPVDLVGLARRAVDDIKALSPEHSFNIEAPPQLVIQADESRLTQVIRNLLDNASKYVPSESGPITVNIGPSEQSGSGPHEVTLSVIDHGQGVPEADLSHLFERLYRSADAQSSSLPGSGLGLYIMARIIKAHGGSIRAERSEGGGLTVSFTLPVSPQE